MAVHRSTNDAVDTVTYPNDLTIRCGSSQFKILHTRLMGLGACEVSVLCRGDVLHLSGCVEVAVYSHMMHFSLLAASYANIIARFRMDRMLFLQLAASYASPRVLPM